MQSFIEKTSVDNHATVVSESQMLVFVFCIVCRQHYDGIIRGISGSDLV